MNKEKLLNITNSIILIFLTVHIFAVNFSIALASISFVIWSLVWFFQMIYIKPYSDFQNIFKEIKFFTIFLIAYCIIEILSRIFAVLPEEFYDGLKRMPLVLIFYITILKITDKKILYRIILTILSVMTIISIIELIRFVIELKSIFASGDFLNNRLGYFSYPLTTAEIKMLFIVLLFPLFSLKGTEYKKLKLILLLLLLPIFISAILTMSRNVYLAIFISILLYGIFINRKVFIYFFISIIMIWFLLPSAYKIRIESIFKPGDHTNISRIVTWQTGWQMFLDHPLLGIGDNKITEVYKMYKPIEYHGEGSHMHSNFFQILATTGLLGTITFWGMFVALFIAYIKIYKKLKIYEYKLLTFGCILALISFQIAGIFEWVYGDWEVICVFWFISSLPFVLNKLENLKNINN